MEEAAASIRESAARLEALMPKLNGAMNGFAALAAAFQKLNPQSTNDDGEASNPQAAPAATVKQSETEL
jgi:hypothetical protein